MVKKVDIVELFRLGGSNRILPLPAITENWPESIPLDASVVRSALWHHKGNITMTALYLRVDIARLRRYVVNNNEEFADDLAEIKERILSHARHILACKVK